jgi:hypothetical protein
MSWMPGVWSFNTISCMALALAFGHPVASAGAIFD